MGKSTISMAIFNSYVKLPEGIIPESDISPAGSIFLKSQPPTTFFETSWKPGLKKSKCRETMKHNLGAVELFRDPQKCNNWQTDSDRNSCVGAITKPCWSREKTFLFSYQCYKIHQNTLPTCYSHCNSLLAIASWQP